MVSIPVDEIVNAHDLIPAKLLDEVKNAFNFPVRIVSKDVRLLHCGSEKGLIRNRYFSIKGVTKFEVVVLIYCMNNETMVERKNLYSEWKTRQVVHNSSCSGIIGKGGAIIRNANFSCVRDKTQTKRFGRRNSVH